MQTYFNINYEFEPEEVHAAIARRLDRPGADYIAVADGVILDIANRNPDYLEVINSGMFAVCDSSYVPLYIRLLYGKRYKQYCGSQIFRDVVSSRKYRMMFLGTQQHILDALQANIAEWNPDVRSMRFVELPFRTIDEFDYAGIAAMVEQDRPDIVWVALGAPKQEYFMNRLRPHLSHGVMIAVGAAFKFYSGLEEKRAPEWMVRSHLEFVYRIMQEPKKQLRRCGNIVCSLPPVLWAEYRRKRKGV